MARCAALLLLAGCAAPESNRDAPAESARLPPFEPEYAAAFGGAAGESHLYRAEFYFIRDDEGIRISVPRHLASRQARRAGTRYAVGQDDVHAFRLKTPGVRQCVSPPAVPPHCVWSERAMAGSFTVRGPAPVKAGAPVLKISFDSLTFPGGRSFSLDEHSLELHVPPP